MLMQANKSESDGTSPPDVLGHISLVQCRGPISSALHKCVSVADCSKGI